ncbi:BamA/TamA family outer membrane protein [Arcicella sp. DC2W]|uniref:BamA/TamA family outer membrane protein n=1 Tax=Arcicella gelida TaxID=2984195 RepID=A0ABU5S5G3_9BACT|nr:BamA/TamA family outer membrane protein [Arcicella sp. DC2W]MEA5403709.1 BamA/TamA family outer membrane protein [Arcicella sp. DC2W]
MKTALKQHIVTGFSILLTILGNATLGYSQTTPNYSIFLIGDAGEPPKADTNQVLTPLKRQMQKAGKNSSVVFLGDNVYPKGLSNLDEPNRKNDSTRLADQLSILKDYEGKPFIIPGNHDWQQGGKKGWEYIQNQEKFVSDFLKREDVFFPKGGCPTPHEVALNDQVTAVILDTQWWLHPWKKPEAESDCEVKSLEEMLVSVNDILDRNRHKKVIVMGHHPMYSHGSHGGYFTLADHLLPFHELNVNIPLPVLGSIYPLYRTLIGDIQDIPHPKYKQMRDGLVGIFKQYKNVIYANGHEHNLQLIQRDSINYITSGAGSKNTPVKMGKDSKFASSQVGFARLDFFDNKTVLTFLSGDGENGKELYCTEILLNTNAIDPKDLQTAKIQTEGIVPNPLYKAGKLKSFLLGKNYRDIWTTAIKPKTIDFEQEQGGLKVIQRGGGYQTLSLRYQNPKGEQFVTRSVEKYPERAVPDAIRSKFTTDIVSDQISASHPFAALVASHLAEAAGVLHTNPSLVIIPESNVLGNYKRLFTNQLALFEERPEGSFGGSKKIQSTQKVVEKLAEDNHNNIDEKEVIRARLLDMLIGDWDRHEDQWRWAGFENKNDKGLTYRPIPRDRDQAFFVNQGLLPTIISRKWILPKIQGFDYKIRDVAGLAFNARYFDRSFLTQSSEKDWLSMATELQLKISDSVIDSAVSHFPNFPEHSAIIAKKLKQRRNDLTTYSKELYEFLSKEVDILGSDKDEFFFVNRLENGETKVSVYDQKKNGEIGRVLYERTFEPKITKEIRIWGLDGEDNFQILGKANRGIKVRLIGGKGKDIFSDSSEVAGFGKKTLIYDKKDNTSLYLGSEAKDLTSKKKTVNDYNREAFKYDRIAPLASFAFNVDDGIFIGTGLQWTRQGFRKDPFASQHSISGNYAFGTNSYNIFYKGEFMDVIGKTDFELKANIQQGGLVDNFFGLSNESEYKQEKGIDYYRIQYENEEITALFKSRFNKLTLYYGAVKNEWHIKENPKRFIHEFTKLVPNGDEIYQDKFFIGLKTGFVLDNRDNIIFPTRGILWNFDATLQRGANDVTENKYANLKTDLSFYYTFKLPAVVSLATRFGGGMNLADYELYQANSLGGLSNIRGYRRTRFSGKSSFYNNTEIRLKVINIKSYLFPAYAGVLAFNDVGRVWNPNENSEKWHHGYGAGVWVAPFNMVVITGMYGITEESNLFSVKAGLFF